MGYYLLEHDSNLDQYRSTRRNGAKATGTIILHSAENVTDLSGADTGAESVARYITQRSTYGSYHVLVDRDSTIKMVPIDYETWHCVPSNNWSVGISVAWRKGDLSTMNRAERDSYYEPFALAVLDVVAQFAARGITVPLDRFLTRSEVMDRKPGLSTHSRTDPSRRSDPFGTGSKYEQEFLDVLEGLVPSGGGGSNVGGGGSSSGGGSTKRVSVDGKWGSDTTTELQKDLGAPYKDGEVSRQNVYWRDDNPGLTTGWEWIDRDEAVSGEGSQTLVLFADLLRALGYKPGKSDGLFGPKFWSAAQEWLTDLGLYEGDIDGEVWKPSTGVKALQRAINRGLVKKAAKEAGIR